tara:strand:+ start:529 stop:843 length:315 start_codon:yes stop_codon:yes gene_type:complete
MADHLKDVYLGDRDVKIPNVEIDVYIVNGELRKWEGKTADVYSPIQRKEGGEQIRLGSFPMLGEEQALEALASAKNAFNFGRGQVLYLDLFTILLFKLSSHTLI